MKVPDHIPCVLTVILSSLWLNFNLARCASLPGADSTSSDCRNSYDYKYYYDHGTERCEQCREICHMANLKGTTEQCQRECKQYLIAMECLTNTDTYYDAERGECSQCSKLCDNHQATGDTRDCREQCNAYLETLTPKQVPSRHKQNYLKAMDGSDTEGSQSSNLLIHPGWIAAISVAILAVICFAAMGFIFYRTNSRYNYDATPQDDGPRQPVEETSQDSGDAHHFAIIDGASNPIPVTAFSEMRHGEIPSTIT